MTYRECATKAGARRMLVSEVGVQAVDRYEDPEVWHRERRQRAQLQARRSGGGSDATSGGGGKRHSGQVDFGGGERGRGGGSWDRGRSGSPTSRRALPPPSMTGGRPRAASPASSSRASSRERERASSYERDREPSRSNSPDGREGASNAALQAQIARLTAEVAASSAANDLREQVAQLAAQVRSLSASPTREGSGSGSVTPIAAAGGRLSAQPATVQPLQQRTRPEWGYPGAAPAAKPVHAYRFPQQASSDASAALAAAATVSGVASQPNVQIATSVPTVVGVAVSVPSVATTSTTTTTAAAPRAGRDANIASINVHAVNVRASVPAGGGLASGSQRRRPPLPGPDQLAAQLDSNQESMKARALKVEQEKVEAAEQVAAAAAAAAAAVAAAPIILSDAVAAKDESSPSSSSTEPSQTRPRTKKTTGRRGGAYRFPSSPPIPAPSSEHLTRDRSGDAAALAKSNAEAFLEKMKEKPTKATPAAAAARSSEVQPQKETGTGREKMRRESLQPERETSAYALVPSPTISPRTSPRTSFVARETKDRSTTIAGAEEVPPSLAGGIGRTEGAKGGFPMKELRSPRGDATSESGEDKFVASMPTNSVRDVSKGKEMSNFMQNFKRADLDADGQVSQMEFIKFMRKSSRRRKSQYCHEGSPKGRETLRQVRH